jgi:hypothetical protein
MEGDMTNARLAVCDAPVGVGSFLAGLVALNIYERLAPPLAPCTEGMTLSAGQSCSFHFEYWHPVPAAAPLGAAGNH